MEFEAAERNGTLVISDVEKQYLYVVNEFDMTGIDSVREAVAGVLKLSVDRVEYVEYRNTRNKTAIYKLIVWPF